VATADDATAGFMAPGFIVPIWSVWAWAMNPEEAREPTRHAAAPKKRQEMAVITRTDVRRKRSSRGKKSLLSDASFRLYLLLVTAGQSRLDVFLVKCRS